MEYVKSNQGGFKLLYNNHMYVKQKVLKNGAVCWECDQRRNKFACKTKLPVLDDQIIKVTNDHTHAVNRGEVQASKVRQEMKKRARETKETLQCYRRFVSSLKKGCFFHFSRAVFRKIQSLGLQVRYKDEEDFAHKVRMLAGLAFVPEPDVIIAFEAVSEDFTLDSQAVIDYFEDTYIGRLRPGGRDIMQYLRGLIHNISM